MSQQKKMDCTGKKTTKNKFKGEGKQTDKVTDFSHGQETRLSCQDPSCQELRTNGQGCRPDCQAPVRIARARIAGDPSESPGRGLPRLDCQSPDCQEACPNCQDASCRARIAMTQVAGDPVRTARNPVRIAGPRLPEPSPNCQERVRAAGSELPGPNCRARVARAQIARNPARIARTPTAAPELPGPELPENPSKLPGHLPLLTLHPTPSYNFTLWLGGSAGPVGLWVSGFRAQGFGFRV